MVRTNAVLTSSKTALRGGFGFPSYQSLSASEHQYSKASDLTILHVLTEAQSVAIRIL